MLQREKPTSTPSYSEVDPSATPSRLPRSSAMLPKAPEPGSVALSAAEPRDRLRALAGLPLTALVVADRRIAAVTQRATVLLRVPAHALEQSQLADLLGEAATTELFPEWAPEMPNWDPQTLPALPIRIEGAIRACACRLIPFGRPGVGLLLLEGWGPSAMELPSDEVRQSSASYLIAGVAHEINNPLTFVIPTLEELRSGLESHREALCQFPVGSWLSHLDEALQGIARIAGVVQNLRAAREGSADAEPTLVNQVIANALRLTAASLPSHISIQRDLGLVLPARGNRQRLGQVVFNLIINAIHAIEDSGQTSGSVFVRTWSDSRFTWLEVRDDGPGVSEAHRKKIFEPFFTTRSTGSGLGLAVCRAMVREFGGDLTLRRASHPGACFLIRLPVWPIESRPSATIVTTSAGVGAARCCKVLLVDDDPPVRRALRRMLAKYHQVDEAGALHEALEKIKTHEYDVLVTDLVMSHGGGPALIEQLKAMNSPIADHVVVISGMAPDDAPLPYPRISKPCSEEELLRAIDSASH